jgi:hypothetical protein
MALWADLVQWAEALVEAVLVAEWAAALADTEEWVAVALAVNHLIVALLP